MPSVGLAPTSHRLNAFGFARRRGVRQGIDRLRLSGSGNSTGQPDSVGPDYYALLRSGDLDNCRTSRQGFAVVSLAHHRRCRADPGSAASIRLVWAAPPAASRRWGAIPHRDVHSDATLRRDALPGVRQAGSQVDRPGRPAGDSASICFPSLG